METKADYFKAHLGWKINNDKLLFIWHSYGAHLDLFTVLSLDCMLSHLSKMVPSKACGTLNTMDEVYTI